MEPRLGVAGARARRGGTHGFEAEPGVVEQHRHLAILVKACGKAERIGEFHAHNLGFQYRIGVVEHLAARPHQRRYALGHLAERNHAVMRLIRRHVEHEIRLDDVLVAEREQVGSSLVHGIMPETLGNVAHNRPFALQWHTSVYATNQ